LLEITHFLGYYLIVQAKDELYGLFTAISTAHRKLYELGEGNSEDVVAQRRRAAKKRKIPPMAGREKKSQQNSAGFFVWVTIKER